MLSDEEDEFLFKSDAEYDDEVCSPSTSSVDVQNIEYKVSNKTYRVEFASSIDIFKHAATTKNCILNANWRCTQHFGKFSVNIFKRNIWMLMTRVMDDKDISQLLQTHFGMTPIKISVVNITIMVKLGVPLCLETLHDSLCGGGMIDILNGISNESFYFMDKQKFPALISKPDKEKDLVLELYATGAVNITGIKSNDQIDTAMCFLRNRIVPIINS